jgi:CDP-diacylglycerol--glycerol-3-phosphate 3-phosphatidyltransferase
MAKILSGSRAAWGRAIEPVARAFVRAGISPDAVTLAGTAGIIVAAVGFAARGQLLIATIIATVAAFTDLIDGTMARLRGRSSRYGALLDSTMDRVADGAIFASLTFWLSRDGDWWGAVAGLISLVASQVVSYVRARAEGLGLTAKVGLMERPERLVLVGVGGLLAGFHVPHGMTVVLWLLATGSVITVIQRMVHVRAEAASLDRSPEAAEPAADTEAEAQ